VLLERKMYGEKPAMGFFAARCQTCDSERMPESSHNQIFVCVGGSCYVRKQNHAYCSPACVVSETVHETVSEQVIKIAVLSMMLKEAESEVTSC
jgi:hypothetical protein